MTMPTFPERWGPEIDAAITRAQLPRATASLRAGGRLDFEYFWMTMSQIGAGRRAVPWSDVVAVSVRDGWVSIRTTARSGSLESLPVSLIPNFTIFRTLAEEMSAAATRGRTWS